ncbi:MAG: hypothetical protein IIC60_03085 [Proteobacteria bacterium]|nr:hypothetical protein [Pseudomonadota bacterium]
MPIQIFLMGGSSDPIILGSDPKLADLAMQLECYILRVFAVFPTVDVVFGATEMLKPRELIKNPLFCFQ